MIVLSAATYAADATKAEIDALIEKLGSAKFDEREKAVEKLIAVGTPAVDALKLATKHVEIEVRMRAEKVLGEILPSANKIVDMGLVWLHTHQEADGRWDSKKHGSPVDHDIEQTSLALLAFLGAGHTEKVGEHKECVKKAVAWLRSRQNDAGRISREADGKIDCIAHGLAMLALAEAAGMANIPATRASAQKAAAYASESLQVKKDGYEPTGFPSVTGGEADLLATTVFTMAFKSVKVAGLTVHFRTLDGLIAFLDSVETKGEYARKPGGEPALADTLGGLLCRQFLGWKREDLQASAERACTNLVKEAATSRPDPFHVWLARLITIQQGGDLWRKTSKSLFESSREAFEVEAGMGSFKPAKSELSNGRVASTAMEVLGLEVYYRYLLLNPNR
ncbi:MAG TPA: hypothetical protein VEJ63_12905 [Planctomycetota bacterium]|nr:hypothetical protein [Planctomycetota bacterium]